MTCRAPTSSATCQGTQTGPQLAYDNEGRLITWQNTPTSPTSTDVFAYDGTGQRVWQQAVQGGATTSWVYVGGLAEYKTTSGGTSTYKYYSFAGKLVAGYGLGSLHDFLTDQVGSIQVELTTSGSVQNATLRRASGSARYGPVSYLFKGFTGQLKDDVTNLVYFNARYYDQDAGVFLSADTVLDGLNRYAYVGGNPETRTDPSGHLAYNFENRAGGSKDVLGAAMNLTTLETVAEATTGIMSIYHDARTLSDPQASFLDKMQAHQDLMTNLALDAMSFVDFGAGDVERGARFALDAERAARGAHLGADVAADALHTCADECRPHDLHAEGGGGNTTLYRAVSPEEFVNAVDSQTFSTTAQSMSGKFFAETGGHAVEWGNRLFRGGPFKIVTTDVPNSFADTLMRWDRLDAIGPARYVDVSQLDMFNEVKSGIREWVP